VHYRTRLMSTTNFFFRLQSSNSFPDTATTEIESQSSDRPVPRCLSYRGPMKGGRHLAFCDCIRCRGKRSRMQTCEKKGTPRVHLGANQETRPRSLITPVLDRWISKFATCASFSARRLRVATSLNWPPRPGPHVLAPTSWPQRPGPNVLAPTSWPQRPGLSRDNTNHPTQSLDRSNQMSCVHLQKLVQLCEKNQLRFSSSDMVHVVCDQCQRQEVCPNLSAEHYEAKYSRATATEFPRGSTDL
jgi:hypothetical protein